MGIALPKVVVEELKRAESAGLSVEEYPLDILTKDLGPDTAVEKHLEGVKQLLEQARGELEEAILGRQAKRFGCMCTSHQSLCVC